MKSKSEEYYRVTLTIQDLSDEYGDLIYYNRWFFFYDIKDVFDFYDTHHVGEKFDEHFIISYIVVESICRIL